jgi:hypothetical protein
LVSGFSTLKMISSTTMTPPSSLARSCTQGFSQKGTVSSSPSGTATCPRNDEFTTLTVSPRAASNPTASLTSAVRRSICSAGTGDSVTLPSAAVVRTLSMSTATDRRVTRPAGVRV